MIKNILKIIDKLINIIIGLLFILATLYVIYSFYDTYTIYNSAKLPNEIIKYMPSENDEEYSLSDLKSINDDICAWIVINDTNVNYPVVQGIDNSEYLNLNYKKEYSISGSIFLDYRNSFDFNDYCSVIYGHNMKGNIMFSDVKAFEKENYFSEHQNGYLYTTNKNYKLKIFAYDNVSAYANEIYNVDNYQKQNSCSEIVKYIKANSLNYKDIEINNSDKIIVLSTCNSAGSTSRAILVAKLEETIIKIPSTNNYQKYYEVETNNSYKNNNDNNTISINFKYIIFVLIILILMFICYFIIKG